MKYNQNKCLNLYTDVIKYFKNAWTFEFSDLKQVNVFFFYARNVEFMILIRIILRRKLLSIYNSHWNSWEKRFRNEIYIIWFLNLINLSALEVKSAVVIGKTKSKKNKKRHKRKIAQIPAYTSESFCWRTKPMFVLSPLALFGDGIAWVSLFASCGLIGKQSGRSV